MIQSEKSAHYCHPIIDQYVIATCQGKLFAGGYLNDANVRWAVKAETTKFTPAKRSDYTFGRAEPIFFWFRKVDQNKILYPEEYFQVIEYLFKHKKDELILLFVFLSE